MEMPGFVLKWSTSRLLASSRAASLLAEENEKLLGEIGRDGRRARRFLEHDMRVGAADAKGADPGTARCFGRGPFLQLRANVKGDWW